MGLNGHSPGLFFQELLRRQSKELIKGKTISFKAHCENALSIRNKATELGVEISREGYKI